MEGDFFFVAGVFSLGGEFSETAVGVSVVAGGGGAASASASAIVVKL